MEQTKKEFLQLLCSIYIIAILVILPLYTGTGYYRLGDSKYLFYRNVSFFCLGAWGVLTGLTAVTAWMKSRLPRGEAVSEKRPKTLWSLMDSCMLLYGFSVVLSAVCSSFGEMVWTGYQDWYMGAISQLLFVGGYFCVSRCFVHSAVIIYLAEAGFAAVIGIGLLNRLGFDPMGLYRGVSKADWTYSHMLSTIGNINWFCGYCSVLLALPLAGFLYSKKRLKTILLYFVSVCGLLLLAIQGSDSGLVLVSVAIGICLLYGRRKAVFFQKGMLLLAGTTLGIRMMGQMIEWRKAWEATPVDGGLYQNMLWNGWLVVSLLACVVLIVHRQLHNRVGKGAAQTFVKVFLLLGAITLVIIGGAITLVDLNEKIVSGSVALASWGSGRGSLWSLACLGFGEADFSEKLIGVGPDCFAPYLLSLGRAPVITKEGYWGNAIFANAHNEWLNQLINIGILGVCCYGSIFVVALKRYRGIFLGILAIVMYGIQSLVSFQQVLSTPFLFLVLGLCEATCRRAKEMEK